MQPWPVLLVLCQLLGSSQTLRTKGPKPGDQAGDHQSPETLLVQSERMGSSFSVDDRAFQLFRLATTASELGSESSHALVERWATKLFQTAQARPKDWNRGAFEKNAVEILSRVDADKAFDLLQKIDPPDQGSSPPPPEDLRAFGARTVFTEFWARRGIKSLPRILAVARTFGRTGEYPYPAMANILEKLGNSDAESAFARDTLADAISFYAQATVIQSSDRDFIEFFNRRWTYLDAPSKVAVLRAAVSQLTLPRADKTSSVFASRLETTAGRAEFDSERMLLLYEIMDKIREVDPDWADKLESDYPPLRQGGGAGAKRIQASEMTVEDPTGDAPKDAANAIVAKGLQAGSLARLKREAPAHVDIAIRILAQITDPEFRAEGMAAIAVALAPTQPSQAHDMLVSAAIAAKGIPADLAAKARACEQVAAASAQLGEQSLYRSAMNEGLDAAMESIAEDIDTHPGRPYYMARGMDELSSLLQLDMRLEPDAAFKFVERMQDGEEKAFLLIDCAEGMIRRPR